MKQGKWVYEKIAAPVFAGPVVLSGTSGDIAFVAPPSSHVQAVYESAGCGDFTDLDEQLDRIKQLDADYAPFVARIRKLARVFQVTRFASS